MLAESPTANVTVAAIASPVVASIRAVALTPCPCLYDEVIVTRSTCKRICTYTTIDCGIRHQHRFNKCVVTSSAGKNIYACATCKSITGSTASEEIHLIQRSLLRQLLSLLHQKLLFQHSRGSRMPPAVPPATGVGHQTAAVPFITTVVKSDAARVVNG